jgi:hypothetical protein
MKSPEMSNQERQNDNPTSRVESNPLVDKLKKDLKFSFWDFQAKNGTNASVVDFANDPSFAKRLSEAKQSGLSMEEMGVAVDYIRDTYGKKRVVQQDNVKVSPLDQKYSVHGDARYENDNPGNGDSAKGRSKDSDGVAGAFDTFQANLDRIKAQSDARHQSGAVEDDLFLKSMRADLDRISAEADVRDKEEGFRIKNESAETERVFLETQKLQAEIREKERLDREADFLHSVERKKQVESFVKNVEKEFSSLVDKWFVTMREDQYDRATSFNSKNDSIERRALYMNNVYLDVRNFAPSGDELQFSIRDNTLVCSAGRSIEGVELASFDLNLDDSSRAQALLDIKNKYKIFANNRSQEIFSK